MSKPTVEEIAQAIYDADIPGMVWIDAMAAASVVSSLLDRRSGNGDAEALARRFHETYERLAPSYGYETRRESAVPWEQVPEKNRRLMTAVCSEMFPGIEVSTAQPDGKPDPAPVASPHEWKALFTTGNLCCTRCGRMANMASNNRDDCPGEPPRKDDRP